MKKLINIFFFILISLNSQAQNHVIGNWTEFLPYNRGEKVADAGSKVYCSTDDGLFAYVKEDASLERFSKLNGLNDFSISSIAYSKEYHVLVITYTDANIDLLYDDHSVFNLPFIKNKNITGNKNINGIFLRGKLAYISCGFGIVVVDVLKQEVNDTYIIGPNGTNRNVYDVADDGINLYAATDSGVFIASLNSSNLADFNNWSITLADLNNNGDFNQVEFFNGKIYVNYAKPDATNTSVDELWMFDGLTWSKVVNISLPQQPKRYDIKTIDNELIVTNELSVSIFDAQLALTHYYDQTVYNDPHMRDALKESNGTLWIADHTKGLVKIENNNTATLIFPKGPYSIYTADLVIDKGKLWVAHGPRSYSWSPQDYPLDGFSLYSNGSWQSWNNANTPSLGANNFFSNMSIAIVPGQSEHIRVGSVTSGMLDFNNNSVTAYYNANNSTLIPAVNNETQTKVHGMVHDESGNLWVVNSGVQNMIHVLKSDNTWKNFSMQGVIDGNPFAGYIIIDQQNNKWVNLFGGSGAKNTGLIVFNESGTIDNTSDDQKKFIPMSVSSTPRCMAMDLDGQIWVGTDEGPQIIYSPGSAFDGDVTPQKILIKQDNTYQYLLELETITAIAVDGANRKWIGTLNSGIYLLSADGQNEIHHFTFENSPIFSNNIACIGIDQQSGEVFIGTDKGLISYRSDAIKGGDVCDDVTVYPNPVRPGYNGPIAIKGLMNNARIKITDISGNVVYESIALGGQAIWNGRNLKGEQASSGVYLVFASDNAGDNACISKLLFMK